VLLHDFWHIVCNAHVPKVYAGLVVKAALPHIRQRRRGAPDRMMFRCATRSAPVAARLRVLTNPR
jgi:hypothetical protein